MVDLNGKRQEWQGVALIPFIDEVRLRVAMAPLDKKLTEDEGKSQTNSFSQRIRRKFIIHARNMRTWRNSIKRSR